MIPSSFPKQNFSLNIYRIIYVSLNIKELAFCTKKNEIYNYVLLQIISDDKNFSAVIVAIMIGLEL